MYSDAHKSLGGKAGNVMIYIFMSYQNLMCSFVRIWRRDWIMECDCHQWINSLMSIQLNVREGGEALSEDVGHWGNSLEGYLFLSSFDFSLLPNFHAINKPSMLCISAMLPRLGAIRLLIETTTKCGPK